MRCTSSTFPRGLARAAQRGFGIVTALFLIVVLAALGAFMVTVFGLQQAAGALDVQSARAYHAARAGIEWGIYQATVAASCAPAQTLTPGGTLAAFSVNVQCTAYTADELGTTVRLYEIVATACNAPPCPNPAANPGPRYLERQLRAVVGP